MSDRALRSEIMRAVKSKNTAPEILVRKLIHRMGFRYRLNVSNLPGKPDLVFSSRKKVIFVNGCFWHGHNCARGARVPKSNIEYWKTKIRRNMRRDTDSLSRLKSEGWNSLVLWECELKNIGELTSRAKEFLS